MGGWLWGGAGGFVGWLGGWGVCGGGLGLWGGAGVSVGWLGGWEILELWVGRWARGKGRRGL